MWFTQTPDFYHAKIIQGYPGLCFLFLLFRFRVLCHVCMCGSLPRNAACFLRACFLSLNTLQRLVFASGVKTGAVCTCFFVFLATKTGRKKSNCKIFLFFFRTPLHRNPVCFPRIKVNHAGLWCPVGPLLWCKYTLWRCSDG